MRYPLVILRKNVFASSSAWAVIMACILTAVCTERAKAVVLSYDGFAAADYTEGPVTDQPYAGTGYAAGGTWNTQATM